MTTFLEAARSGDMTALERLFAADVTSLSDGNGAYQVARRPVVGAARVGQFLNAITWCWDGLDVRRASTNGQPSAVLSRDGTVYGVLALSATTEGLDQVLWILNPREGRGALRSGPTRCTVTNRGRPLVTLAGDGPRR